MRYDALPSMNGIPNTRLVQLNEDTCKSLYIHGIGGALSVLLFTIVTSD